MSQLLEYTTSHDVNMNSMFNTPELKGGIKEWFLHRRPLLLSVFRFIEENYKDSISLREVALVVGRSPAYLTDLVRRETGKTVLSWIVERRMVEARRLLLETSQSIEQIAEAVGYFDRRHFSRQFLRFHNTTPQVWRKTHQSWSIPLNQVNPQNAVPNDSAQEKPNTMTAAEAQRIQVCVQEIAAILYKNNASGEELALKLVELSTC